MHDHLWPYVFLWFMVSSVVALFAALYIGFEYLPSNLEWLIPLMMFGIFWALCAPALWAAKRYDIQPWRLK